MTINAGNSALEEMTPGINQSTDAMPTFGDSFGTPIPVTDYAPSFADAEDGTSEGAKKAWESRQRGVKAKTTGFANAPKGVQKKVAAHPSFSHGAKKPAMAAKVKEKSDDPTVEEIVSMPPDKGFKAFQEMAGPQATRGDFRMFTNQVKYDIKAEEKAKKVGHGSSQTFGGKKK